MCKVSNSVVSRIIDELLTNFHSYNLRSKSSFVIPSVRTVQSSIHYQGPLTLNTIPFHILCNFRHIQNQNLKMEAHQLVFMSPLQNICTKSRFHKSGLIQNLLRCFVF